MNSLSTSNDTINDVLSIEDLAAGWVVDRGNQKDWTSERQAELDTWLAQSVAHRVAYVRIEAGWRRSDRLAALRSPMHGHHMESAPSRKMIWARIAAAFGLAVITGLVATDYFFQPKSQLIETPMGGQERLTLADGSRIELNTDSAVRIDLQHSQRAVELVRGEAYFQVKHDPEHPFVVQVAGRKIVDLGTKFAVRSTSRSFEIALLEGSVSLEAETGDAQSRAITLSPGDVAVATAGNVSVSKVSKRRITDRLAWQRGMIVFHNATLAYVAAEFNRYGGPQLSIASPEIAGLTINGRFKIMGAGDFAANAHEIFGLRVEHNGGNIILAR